MANDKSCFVTLTYRPADLPPRGSLSPIHTQLFLKRLRFGYSGRIRYYLCGEYGDETQRPHYHACLFGLGVEDAAHIFKSWGYADPGGFQIGDLSAERAGYVAGYHTKKMTASDDVRLNGRHPEFSRKSLKPGIGALGMKIIAETLQSEMGSLALQTNRDVPHVLRIGKKTFPLHRYLRQVLQKEVGLSESDLEYAKAQFWQKHFAEMRDVQTSNPGLSLQKALVKKFQQKIWNVESRVQRERKKL